MDKKPHIKPYIYGMLAGFGAISLSILFFFFIYRFDGFGDAVSTMTGILMPFIYGAVIAYLLKPVCNSIESFLHRIFPQKMHGLANMLAIAATLLFGILVVYALVMMVVPQVISASPPSTTRPRPASPASCGGSTRRTSFWTMRP